MLVQVDGAVDDQVQRPMQRVVLLDHVLLRKIAQLQCLHAQPYPLKSQIVYMTINSLKGIDVRGSGKIVSDTKFNTENNIK